MTNPVKASASREQRVGAVLVEAERGSDRPGEDGESAGDERRVGAGRAHRGDQGFRAGHDLDALGEQALHDIGGEPLEEQHALAQRRLEGDLAAHGALGDRRDLVARADLGRQLVDAFLLDQGGVHVGDEQFLAAMRDAGRC